MAQSLIPLQILQSATPTAAHQLSLPSLLPAGLPQSSVAGGPIHGHAPQHRFRYSPLAGAPLIRYRWSIYLAAIIPLFLLISSPNSVRISLQFLSPLLGLRNLLAQGLLIEEIRYIWKWKCKSLFYGIPSNLAPLITHQGLNKF
jgi:hypothetical protein